MTRFTLADLGRAHSEWGCNCGPAALAAVCDMTLDEVRQHFGPDWPWYTNPTRMFTALRRTGRSWRPSMMGATPGSRAGKTWPHHGLARIQWDGPWLKPGVNQRAAYRYTHWVGASLRRPAAVSIDPEVSLGRPVLAGTRAQVAIAADLVGAGETIDAVAREFGVVASTVSGAVAWHRGEGERLIWDINALGDRREGWLIEDVWRASIVPALTAAIKRATGGWHITHAIEVDRWLASKGPTS